MELIRLSGKTQNKHFMLTDIPKVSIKCKWNMYNQTMFFVSSNKELMILKRVLIYEFDSKVHSNLCSCPTECMISHVTCTQNT